MRIFYNSAGGLQSVAYTPDGRILTLDNRVRLARWDITAGRPERLADPPTYLQEDWGMLKGFRSARNTVAILTSAEFRRYDLAARAPLPSFVTGSGRVSDASEDGTLAVVNDVQPTGYADAGIRWRLWDAVSVTPLDDFFHLPGHRHTFGYTPLLAPNNQIFAVSSASDGRVLLWDRDNPTSWQLAHAPIGRHYALLAFAPDSRFLAAAQVARKGLVSVWDLPEGKLRWSLPQDVFVWALAVHPSGNLLAVATAGASGGPVVRFLDAATGAELTRFAWNAGKIRSLAFSPDGLTCAAGCTDRRLVVWDVDG